ncbi:MAG: hypothetical protein WCY49_00905 [Anaerovoracaceae bacterium]|nr:hypothetical protein [Clostridiales bacterium]
MKILAEPIDALVFFHKGKIPTPYKFKYVTVPGERETVYVDKILEVDEQKIAGIRSFVYKCQSIIGEEIKRYELKYIIEEYRWELYKM